jgi:hypothetical protein
MHIPNFCWNVVINPELLHAVYTLNLPIDDAIRLQSYMKRMRKLYMILML